MFLVQLMGARAEDQQVDPVISLLQLLGQFSLISTDDKIIERNTGEFGVI
ncbi:hypothetical protein [uncultured Rossellomorea sp.]|nr:hypothetical protein [uncultured Rossellomorea sp.]